MSRIKRLYCFILALWLVACGLRFPLSYLGDYYRVGFDGVHGWRFWSSAPPSAKVPLFRFAELNRRLAEAQPGSRFYFTPTDRGDNHMGIIVSPAMDGSEILSPAAEEVLKTWVSENQQHYDPCYACW